jgi:hypothetical protein
MNKKNKKIEQIVCLLTGKLYEIESGLFEQTIGEDESLQVCQMIPIKVEVLKKVQRKTKNQNSSL